MQRHIPHAPSPEEVFKAKQASFPLFVADVDLRSLREASVANRMVMFDRPQELALDSDLAIPPLELLFKQAVINRSEATDTKPKQYRAQSDKDYPSHSLNDDTTNTSEQIEITAVNNLFECAYSLAPVHSTLMKRAKREFNQPIDNKVHAGEALPNSEVYKTSENLFLRLFDFTNPTENQKNIKAIEEVWQKSNLTNIDKQRILAQITKIVDGSHVCRMHDVNKRISLANQLLREIAFGKQENKEPASKVGLAALLEANPVRAIDDIANYLLG